MDAADAIRDHQVRCQPHLATLRMLARDQAGGAPARQVAEEAGLATAAVLAEVQAAGLATLAAVADDRRARALLETRLDRLRVAAGAVADAAQCEDAAGLRHQVRRFETLTSAMWTVQQAMPGRASQPVRRARLLSA